MNLPAKLAWNQAPEQGLHRFAVVELGLAPDPARLLRSELPHRPLMHQGEFAHLRNHGPWLFECSALDFDTFLNLPDLAGSPALMGWLRSACPLGTLAEHLGDALLAEDETGSVYLLRSYTPATLPLLHARTDAPWQPWLFGPLADWWLPDANGGWRALAGLGLAQPGDYRPIRLDNDLWHALDPDPQAHGLTAELERTAPELFASDCHGDRLAQVREAFDAGRQEGLARPEDLHLFAILSLSAHDRPTHWPEWPAIKAKVQQERWPLADAIRTVRR